MLCVLYLPHVCMTGEQVVRATASTTHVLCCDIRTATMSLCDRNFPAPLQPMGPLSHARRMAVCDEGGIYNSLKKIMRRKRANALR